MSEMLDRVSDAVSLAWDEAANVPFPLYDLEAWEIAKAAIGAMRVPNQKMLKAMTDHALSDSVDSEHGGWHGYMTRLQAVMIDAALSQ